MCFTHTLTPISTICLFLLHAAVEGQSPSPSPTSFLGEDSSRQITSGSPTPVIIPPQFPQVRICSCASALKTPWQHSVQHCCVAAAEGHFRIRRNQEPGKGNGMWDMLSVHTHVSTHSH